MRVIINIQQSVNLKVNCFPHVSFLLAIESSPYIGLTPYWLIVHFYCIFHTFCLNFNFRHIKSQSISSAHSPFPHKSRPSPALGPVIYLSHLNSSSWILFLPVTSLPPFCIFQAIRWLTDYTSRSNTFPCCSCSTAMSCTWSEECSQIYYAPSSVSQ